MKLNKKISKFLVLGMLTNNIYFNSSANTDIPNRYQTLEGEYITINDSSEGNLGKIEIFGNTVQDPDNLEDIQSVGDLYVDENGNPILDKQGREQYKINIVANGKNLLNLKDEYDVPTRTRFLEAYELKPNQQYTFSLNYLKGENFAILLSNTYSNILNHDELYKKVVTEGNGIELCGRLTNNLTFNSENYKYMYVTSWVYDSDGIKVNKLQLEEGSNATEYKPFQEDVFTIILPCKLERVSDISDKIVKKNGVWGIEKNIVTQIVESSKMNNMGTGHSFTPNHIYYYGDIINNGVINTSRINVITSHFKSIAYNDYNLDDECAYATHDRFYAYVHPSKDFNGRFFEMNDVLIKYATTKPEFIPLLNQEQLKINLLDDTTHIFTNTENGINPTLKVVVDRLPRIAKNAIEEAENDSTSYNISLARMYINMLPESLYKDQLQEQLSEVFSSDITLDKESASSNLDVYIKSQNMLSISLDTNSITFDGYSGVDAMELRNAVNLTVNSSLPYDLNAYMPAEITNSDGSSIINFDILNIKESSESTYQQFANTTNKVVLKSDCAKGNGNIHNIDLKLDSNTAHKADVYKTVIKFEAEQK